MSLHAHARTEVQFNTDAASVIRQHLTNAIGSHRYAMWFNTTTFSVRDTTLEVTTDSQFVAQWIQSRMSTELAAAAQQVLGDHAIVNVQVHQARTADAQPQASQSADAAPYPFPASRQTQAPSHVANAPAKPRRTTMANLRCLEDLVVGASNQLAYSAARALAEDIDAVPISPLFIHGDCGVGKTHLLQGVCRRAASVFGQENVRYVTGEQFTNEFITAVRNQTVDAFRNRLRRLGLLAIDDVQFLSNKSRTQSEFLHTIDAIGHLGSRIVLASNEHPRQIAKFTPSLISRLLAGMVVKVDAPDKSMRLKLVHHIAAKRNFVLLEAAADMIASRCVGSVRELEGIITKLAAMQSLTSPGSNQVGSLLVEQLLSDHHWQSAEPIRISTVIDAVCARLNVSRSDLMGTGRHRRVVLARSLVAFLGRELTTMSFPEIARAMGRAHHSTVHTAARRLSDQLEANQRVELSAQETDVALSDLVDQLRHAITRRK